MQKTKVFLSHSSADHALARRLASDLEAANIDVWLDQWVLKVGEKYAPKIERAVEEADFVIVLLTRQSVASEGVFVEWQQKFKEEEESRYFSLIPVRAESCDIPDFLAQRSYADISGGSYPHGLKHLLDIIRHHGGQSAASVSTSNFAAVERSLDHMVPVVTPIGLEISGDLAPLFEQGENGGNLILDELTPAMQDDLAWEFGFLFPGVRFCSSRDLPPGTAIVLIEEIPVVYFHVASDDIIVDSSVEKLSALGIEGQPFVGPAIVSDCCRIAAVHRDAVTAAGIPSLDAAEYLIAALKTVIRNFATDFIDIDTASVVVEVVKQADPELVERTVPAIVPWFELTDVFRCLVAEGIGLGDAELILRNFSSGVPNQRDAVNLTARAREALSEHITAKFSQDDGSLHVLMIGEDLEKLMADGIQDTATGPYFALEPERIQSISQAIRQAIDELGDQARGLPLLTGRQVRPFLRNVVSLEFPWLSVLSRNEIAKGTVIRAVAHISLAELSNATSPARDHGQTS